MDARSCPALILLGLLCSCAPNAKYPSTAVNVYCTNVVNDCEAQSKQACPAGYRTLDKESYTPRSWANRPGERYHPVRHDKVVIECDRAG